MVYLSRRLRLGHRGPTTVEEKRTGPSGRVPDTYDPGNIGRPGIFDHVKPISIPLFLSFFKLGVGHSDWPTFKGTGHRLHLDPAVRLTGIVVFYEVEARVVKGRPLKHRFVFDYQVDCCGFQLESPL